jgi:hypothetical protein
MTFPDIVAWVQQSGSRRAIWIVEVETTDSLTEGEVASQWAKYSATGVPLSVAVPVGAGGRAWWLARSCGVKVQKVLEYGSQNGTLVVHEVPASATVHSGVHNVT